MLCIIDNHTTDPYWNLAAEEYLLTSFSEPIFRIWRNSDSIIVGKNQNTFAEINIDFVERNNIAVVRRLTGGGTVFHDLGNVNYTFIDRKNDSESTDEMFRRFTAPIIRALKSLGVDACLSGRNDLLIGGRKFSGNAICIHGDRLLQHGTLLFRSSMNNLAEALIVHEDKFIGKGVKSTRSRVTNISEHLLVRKTTDEFFNYMANFCIAEGNFQEYHYCAEDIAAINALADSKYRCREWNYGRSPKCSINHRQKFPSGILELSFDIEKGLISNLSINGDYFFKAPTEELCRMLNGVPFEKEKIIDCLNGVAIDDYFSGIDTNQFVSLLFT